jgi:hypothetical protein
MSEIDLDQPANVLWHSRVPPQGAVDHGETRHFDSLRKAIRYVMEEIPEGVRGTAWITTDSGSIQIAEIEALYKRL